MKDLLFSWTGLVMVILGGIIFYFAMLYGTYKDDSAIKDFHINDNPQDKYNGKQQNGDLRPPIKRNHRSSSNDKANNKPNTYPKDSFVGFIAHTGIIKCLTVKCNRIYQFVAKGRVNE